MKEEKVILVNELDEKIGLMPKLEAHEKALLHRAFSVFIFNDNNTPTASVSNAETFEKVHHGNSPATGSQGDLTRETPDQPNSP